VEPGEEPHRQTPTGHACHTTKEKISCIEYPFSPGDKKDEQNSRVFTGSYQDTNLNLKKAKKKKAFGEMAAVMPALL
jgi:hypothetical protein